MVEAVEITTRENLADWLAEEAWFNDGRVYGYRPEPATPAPNKVDLELGRWSEGGLDPGDVRVFRTFQITARGVKRFSIGPPGYSSKHWSEGVELADEGLGFTIDTPGLLRITFDALDVVQLSDRREVVEPWVSDHEFWVSIADGLIPSAEDWIRTVRHEDLDAKWNFCGDEESAAHDPEPFRYEGWCLQMRESGVLEEAFFFGCRPQPPTGYVLSIKRRGVSGRLWNLVRRAAAANPTAVIRAGNVELSASEWHRYLDDETLPTQPRGWSKAGRAAE
jgi:hypothetical protein